MSRIAIQTDLFAPSVSPPDTPVDPIAELTGMLAELREADAHPRTPLSEAVQGEFQAQALAWRAGSEGERLFAKADNATINTDGALRLTGCRIGAGDS